MTSRHVFVARSEPRWSALSAEGAVKRPPLLDMPGTVSRFILVPGSALSPASTSGTKKFFVDAVGELVKHMILLAGES